MSDKPEVKTNAKDSDDAERIDATTPEDGKSKAEPQDEPVDAAPPDDEESKAEPQDEPVDAAPPDDEESKAEPQDEPVDAAPPDDEESKKDATRVDKFPELEKASAKSTGKGMYAALVATVGVAAFCAGLSVPILNQDPVTMSDLDQAILFLEDKIDNLSGDLQRLENAMLTDPGGDVPPQQEFTVTPDDDPVLGSADAPLTLIEFSDFQCPFCARFHSDTLPLIKSNYIDTGIVKMVYRDFPLQSIHPNAVPAAVASECADEQGAYWDYHDMLFERMSEWSPESLEAALGHFKTYAASLELDAEMFSECMDTGKYIEEVTNDYSDGVSYGVTGTPAFFLGNDEIGYVSIAGARPYQEFQLTIEQILAVMSE